MNKILKTTNSRLVRIASGVLIVASAALAASALFAEAPRTREPSGACRQWAADLKQNPPRKAKLRKAFVTALKESARNDTVRQNLMRNSNDAKAEILRILGEDLSEPIFDPQFPTDAWFRFYEPEVPITRNTEKELRGGRARGYPNEHCLHIFHLPEPGTPVTGTDDQIWRLYSRCCYEPW
jgi:hypothetical protein